MHDALSVPVGRDDFSASARPSLVLIGSRKGKRGDYTAENVPDEGSGFRCWGATGLAFPDPESGWQCEHGKSHGQAECPAPEPGGLRTTQTHKTIEHRIGSERSKQRQRLCRQTARRLNSELFERRSGKLETENIKPGRARQKATSQVIKNSD